MWTRRRRGSAGRREEDGGEEEDGCVVLVPLLEEGEDPVKSTTAAEVNPVFDGSRAAAPRDDPFIVAPGEQWLVLGRSRVK